MCYIQMENPHRFTELGGGGGWIVIYHREAMPRGGGPFYGLVEIKGGLEV